jgi:hypothetical protein
MSNDLDVRVRDGMAVDDLENRLPRLNQDALDDLARAQAAADETGKRHYAREIGSWAASARRRRFLIPVAAAIPVLCVNVVATSGQFLYLRDHIHWVPGAAFIAMTIESVAVYLAFHAHLAALANDSALRLRLGAYGFAAVIGAMNYSHFCAPRWRPTPLALIFALASVASPWLWNVHTRRQSRDALMERGLIEPHALRLGATRWAWHVVRSFRVMWYATWEGETDIPTALALLPGDPGPGSAASPAPGQEPALSPPALGPAPEQAPAPRDGGAAAPLSLADAEQAARNVLALITDPGSLPSARDLATGIMGNPNRRKPAGRLIAARRAQLLAAEQFEQTIGTPAGSPNGARVPALAGAVGDGNLPIPEGWQPGGGPYTG